MNVEALSVGQRRAFNAGFVAMIVGLPFLTAYFAVSFLRADAELVWPDAEFWSALEAPSIGTVALYVAWVAFQAALFAWLPGRRVTGVIEADGTRHAYRLNGLFALAISIGVAVAAVALGLVPGGLLYDHWIGLVGAANAVVLLGCIGLAVFARRQATDEERALNWLEAYTLGGCRNPRVGSFDLKFFCESRPSMILWVLIDLSLAAKQYELHGTVSNAMALVCFFQILYVADYFWFEDAILSTWDIKNENFGFMLAWGCLVWIPFSYALQPLYLVHHPEPLPWWGAAGVFALNALGFAIFRSSNLQKHRFASDPTRKIWGDKPEYIETAQGNRLLMSGWWGLSRHSNYLGDWLMGLSWSLTTGFGRWLPYFYPIYFAILLIHREWRDNKHCAAKYGDDWRSYTARVRWRIIPWVY